MIIRLIGNKLCTYKPNIEVHSHIHYRRGKALITVLHILCISIALAIQHAIRMPHITVFFDR
jgi:hypothetical protein